MGNIKRRKQHFLGGEKVPITIGLLMKQIDGGYIVGGVNKFNGSHNLANYYLFKTDSLFNWEWSQKFGQTTIYESRMKIFPKNNNQYYYSVYQADTPIIVDTYGVKWYNHYNYFGIMDSTYNIVNDTLFVVNLALADSATSTYWKSNGVI